MDELRMQFYSESNAQDAAVLKTQMNKEMQNHSAGETLSAEEGQYGSEERKEEQAAQKEDQSCDKYPVSA